MLVYFVEYLVHRNSEIFYPALLFALRNQRLRQYGSVSFAAEEQYQACFL